MPRRFARRRPKRRRLTAAQVTRALASNMRYRGKTLASVFTTSALSAYPIVLRVPTSNAYVKGVTFYDQAMAEAMRNTAATSSNSTYQTVVDYNALVYSNNWVICKVKNNALTPAYVKIYDMYLKSDQAYKKAANTNIDEPVEVLYQCIYESLSGDLSGANLLANLKDTAAAAWSNVDLGMQITSEGLFNSSHPNIVEYFKCKKVHKVFLQPGQTFEWKVKPRQFTVTINTDAADDVMGYNDSTYLPLIMARGDLGLTAAGNAGYTVVELAFEFDFGSHMYMKQVYNNGARGQMINTPNFPAATAIAAPGDDADVN